MRKIAVILLAVLSQMVFATSAPPPKVDWNKLSALCEKSWNAYTLEVERIEREAKLWIRDLDPKAVGIYYDSESNPQNKTMIFIAATWPELLEGKLDGWRSHQDCSVRHIALLRHTMRDRSIDKKAAVQSWTDCVLTRYYLKKIIPPLDKLAACYAKQADVFRD